MPNTFSEMPSRVKFYFHIIKNDDHVKKMKKQKKKKKKTIHNEELELKIPPNDKLNNNYTLYIYRI